MKKEDSESYIKNSISEVDRFLKLFFTTKRNWKLVCASLDACYIVNYVIIYSFKF